MTYHGEESTSSLSKKNIGRIALLLVLIIGGASLFYFRSSISMKLSKVFASTEEDPIPITKLARQPFLLTVPSDGEIVGMETTPVSTPNTPSGSLKLQWLIPEGTFVNAGQPVIRFDSTDSNISLEKQRNTLDANKENTRIKTLQQGTDDKKGRHDQQDQRVKHGRHDFALHLLLARLKIRDLRED